MNKNILIGIVIAVLIVALAIVVGINVGKNNSESTNNEPMSSSTETPNTETDNPSIETESPNPEETPETSPSQIPTEDISNMTDEEKKTYAKNIAKSIWEEQGIEKQVSYSYDGTESQYVYIITVRDQETTYALSTYRIDIRTGSYEVID